MTIQTPRLILCPFASGDPQDMFDYLKEPAANCFACMKLHSPEEATDPDNDAARDDFSSCWMPNKANHDQGYAYEAARAFINDLFMEFVSFVNNPDGMPSWMKIPASTPS